MTKKKKPDNFSKRGPGRPEGATDSKPRKKKKPTGRTFKLRAEWNGHEPRQEIRPGPKPDIEDGQAPDDEASKHKYPPPKNEPIFRRKWAAFIDNIVARDNFNPSHLDALEILCDLYVEYEQLHKFIRVNGRSYCSIGRAGETWKLYPEVNELKRVQGSIKEYTKMLGLLLKADKGGGANENEEKEWA